MDPKARDSLPPRRRGKDSASNPWNGSRIKALEVEKEFENEKAPPMAEEEGKFSEGV
jgi:hypothetical protein